MKVLNKSLRHIRYLSTLQYGGMKEGSISGIVKKGRSYHILQNHTASSSFIFDRNPDFKTVMCKRLSSLSTIAISDSIGGIALHLFHYLFIFVFCSIALEKTE
jgi:hypothetical protein